MVEPERIEGLFDQAEERIAGFKKETYESFFQKYLEDNAPVWNMIEEASSGNLLLQEQEQAREQIADAFIQGACRKAEVLNGRSKREMLQSNLNLYMVCYVIPAINAWMKHDGIDAEEAELLTDIVCAKWQEAFGVRIQASDYEAIQAGFKQKLCFVTTAVCRGLRKPPDCKEITLMKQFRDGYFSESEEGKLLIQEYYDIAPTIVKRISRENNPEEKYLYLWNTYIKRCVEHIENGRNEECSQLYKAMMAELKEEYMVIDRYSQNG